MPPPKNTLKLPHKLLQELRESDAVSTRRKRPFQGTRKDVRKAEGEQKKALRHGPPPKKRVKTEHNVENQSFERPPRSKPIPNNRQEAPTKSILKQTKPREESIASSKSKVAPARISETIRDKLAEDDEEIAALESRLGIKKKLPKAFEDDGLTELLEGLDEDDAADENSMRQKIEGREWLERKRGARKLSELKETDGSDEDSEDGGLSDESLYTSASPDDGIEGLSGGLDGESTFGSDEHLHDEFDGFEDGTDDKLPESPQIRVRENPYIVPVSKEKAAVGKYIPPSLRVPSSSDSEAIDRLRRQTQGLVNRLTEANLFSIVGDFEKLYRESPRQHVTVSLVDTLLAAVCEPTNLPDTLIILHAGFIAAMYKIVGTDFGAHIVQRIVELFHEHYNQIGIREDPSPAANISEVVSKETSNLIALLSEMYSFQVIGSNLIFDYFRLLLGSLSEINAELLLKIIRACGQQLRQDDPSALKDIVSMLRPAVASVGEENLSVRTKFMIEAINDVKNNRFKAGGAASNVKSEHIIRMKKTLGSLNSRSIKASEPLRIGLKDIKDSDKKGKWWLIGASWAGNVDEKKDESISTGSQSQKRTPIADAETTDIVQLAREQHMNTDIRRAIFVSLISASDYQDAYMRLMKLKLKRAQELAIPKVLLHCAGAEKSYNPYYTLIAKRLCGDRRLKMAFQFSLLDFFKRMGESNDGDEDPEDQEDSVDTRHIVNLAKMFGSLIFEGGLGLSVLKNLNLASLQTKTKTFLEVMFITLFLQSQRQAESKRDEKAVVSVVSRIKDYPALIRGLGHFLKKVVRKTEIAGSKADAATVKWACKVAMRTLEALEAVDTTVE